jgi:vibriolysin
MVYGDGNNSDSIELGKDLDVTVHELTHAVTDSESDLVYSGESGGLNESMSDIFAGVCESWNRGWAVDADIFKIGEDIWTPGTAGDALRYMDDPARDGVSLDFYGDYSAGVDVHYSSGISNLVFSLLTKGGTHPRGKSTNAVPAIGPEKAGRIFYKANTDLFTASTTFDQAKTYTIQAAEALFGVGSAEALAVNEAWKAVGVPPPPPVVTALTNGVALTGLSGGKKYYSLQVPAGQGSLVFDMSGGTGDADMHVKFGALPTASSYDCRPYTGGNAENCSFTNPAAGTWYVFLNPYSAFSGVTLKGTYTAGTGGGGGTPVTTTINDSVASGASDNFGPYSVVAGTKFKVVMTGSGDPDLYVRFGAAPTTSTYNCRPYASGASETCDLTVPAGQSSAYVMVRGYTAATYTLNISYTKP